MNRKTVTGILLLVCVLGGAGSVAIYLAADKQGPEIILPAERPVYVEGTDINTLLEGVTAKDDCDGDVTAELMVEYIYPAEENGTAKVVYAAVDSSNNVTKVQRTVEYTTQETEEQTEPTEPAVETVGSNVTAESDAEGMTAEEAKQARIAIVNGTETGGLAGSWGSALQADGFTQITTGSYEGTVEKTVIYADDEGLVRELQVYFAEADAEEEMPESGVDIALEGMDACVVVGNDYTEVTQ